jgi:GntR family transcriptional regulator
MAKYRQITQEIISRIETGLLLPGMRVPSENEIREAYAVSNTTARKALQDLEVLGYAERQKGRGTFVRERTLPRAANKILSFTANMRQAGRVPSTRVLYTGLVETGYTVRLMGETVELPGPAYKIHRLRFADDTPVLLEVRYISRDLCPDIDKKNLESSLYDVYSDDYDLILSRVDQSLEAIMIGESAVQFFGVPAETPGFLVEGATYAAPGRLLELEHSIYRGDTYKFFVSAQGDNSSE